MEIIPYSEFYKLRLHQFYFEKDLEDFDSWEFMGDTWVGEGVGWIDILQLEKNKNRTRSITLDFDENNNQLCLNILNKLKLDIKPNMSLEELISLLGKPLSSTQWKINRSYQFLIGVNYLYYINCIIAPNEGLVFLSILNTKKALKELYQIKHKQLKDDCNYGFLVNADKLTLYTNIKTGKPKFGNAFLN